MSARGALLAAAVVAAAGCAPAERAGAGSVRVSVSLASASSVTRVTLRIGAGDGPSFDPPIEGELQGGGGSWSAFVSGVPAGPGRLFEIAAWASDGSLVESGAARCDIVPGASAEVRVSLAGAPPPPWENAAPVLDYLGASRVRVAPGGEVTLRASAHDPDPGDAVRYRWDATCGALDAPDGSTAIWIAPAAPGVCRLSVTVSDGRGAAVIAQLSMAVAAGRTITGARLVRFWPDPPASMVEVPAPDTGGADAPFALVRDPAGGWDTFPGGHVQADGTFAAGGFGADGTFAVPDVPEGAYVLCWGNPSGPIECTDTAEERVDLGYDTLGRPEQALAAAPTPVQLALSGLDAWNPATDSIQVTSSGADLWDELVPPFRGGLVAGSAVEDWSAPESGALHLLGPEDALFVHQLSTRSFYLPDGRIVFYVAATRAAPGLTGIALASGQPASLAAALAPLPLSASLPLDWDTAAFASRLAELGPPARTAAPPAPLEVWVAANAFPLESPAPVAAGGEPELVRLAVPAGLGRISTTLSYGRFLPALWREWRGARLEADVSYLAPGASAPWIERAVVERRDPLPPAAGELAPALTPVRAPLVNGADARADQAGVGSTPTFVWTPPAVGAPTAYLLELFRLDAEGSVSIARPALRYATEDLGATVPPGVLAPGATYFARITALATSVPYDAAPLRWANVHARATAFTGTFTP